MGLDLWMVNYKYIPFVQSVSWKGPLLNCKSHFEVDQNLRELSLNPDCMACGRKFTNYWYIDLTLGSERC